MDNNGLYFKDLSVDDCFLPANIASKMGIQDLIAVKKNKKYFTKEECSTININSTQIVANAKFNENGNFVFIEDDELVIQIYP